MSYTPPASVLKGMSFEKASLYGMPHIHAWYKGKSINSHTFDHEDRCPLCGRRATNAHHCPPKSVGKEFLLEHERGLVFPLRPALFALDGSGTTGCHGDIHKGLLKVAWEWDSEEDCEWWWKGGFLWYGMPSNSPDLFKFGKYVFTDSAGRKTEVRL